ncbi:hypothetical protein H181DRAFT_00555 [Streptomyces sp. WMMB 714]|nr:hypothetical protein H181DRAFT_00555 [Streptomyces sp. WMMB 714]
MGVQRSYSTDLSSDAQVKFQPYSAAVPGHFRVHSLPSLSGDFPSAVRAPSVLFQPLLPLRRHP